MITKELLSLLLKLDVISVREIPELTEVEYSFRVIDICNEDFIHKHTVCSLAKRHLLDLGYTIDTHLTKIAEVKLTLNGKLKYVTPACAAPTELEAVILALEYVVDV